MKHLKIYENFDDPQVGDYVICKDSKYSPDDPDDIEIISFFENNIGQYISVNGRGTSPENDYFQFIPEYKYIIEYINIPDNLKGHFEFYINDREKYVRGMKRDEILYWSDDKKELEAILAANKYNI